MRHKYIIRISEDVSDLFISEQAEVDRDLFSALCEEKFPLSAIREAAAEGESAVVAALRSVNFYPPLEYASQIAEVVQEMLAGGAPERRELIIDDRQVMAATEAAAEAEAAAEDLPPDVDEIDDLLDDDDDAGPDIAGIEDEGSGEKEDN